MRGPTLLWFHIPTGGPATLTGQGALSMKGEYLQGAPPSVEPLTHTNLYTQVKGSLHGGRLVCPVLYTRRGGVGDIFQPWGKGLRQQS